MHPPQPRESEDVENFTDDSFNGQYYDCIGHESNRYKSGDLVLPARVDDNEQICLRRLLIVCEWLKVETPRWPRRYFEAVPFGNCSEHDPCSILRKVLDIVSVPVSATADIGSMIDHTFILRFQAFERMLPDLGSPKSFAGYDTISR